MNDKWMKDLKSLSGSNEKKAPEGLLDDIKREMSRRGVMPASEEKKSPVLTVKMWQRAAAVIALLVVSGVAVNQLMNDGTENPQEIVEVITPPKNDINSDINVEENLIIQEDEPLLASAGIAKKTARKKSDVTEVAIADQPEISEVTNEPKNIEIEQSQENDSLMQPKDTLDVNATALEQEYLAMNDLPNRPMKQEQRSWGIGAYYGGGTSNSQGGDQGLYEDVPYSDPINGEPGSTLPEQSSGEENLNEEHHQPIRFGISIRYRLNDRWSLQSGLTYSYLDSKLTAWQGSQTVVSDQELHYLGIPLNVNYSVWHNNHVNVYVAAGGEIEKLVKGTLKHGADKMTRPWTEKVKENTPIFSTNASAGVELLVGDYFSIFAEPGASYHFNNGSDVHSAYTDKPLNFNFNIGLRINFNQ